MTIMKDGKDPLSPSYVRPQQLTKYEAFKRFLYDKETGAFLGRTASSWGKIGLFYLFFYGFLAAMVAILFWLFFQTLDPRRPRYQLEESVIGTNPGMGFRPLPPPENVESTLIWYKGTDEVNYKHWVASLDKFLEVYRTPGLTPGRGANSHNCDYDHPPAPGQVCNIDVKKWHPCTIENWFGYHKSSPCIFLKLNKIYGWRPEFYNNTRDLPKNMPKKLVEVIKKEEAINPNRLNTIWVECNGENPADVENIGPIKLFPNNGFPGYYYPYQNNEGYLSPLVAVHFERPRPGVLINVECKAWARNIRHSRAEKVGLVHFELLVD